MTSKHLALTLTLILTGPLALGETLYVTDQLKITLRSGTSTRNKIIQMLPIGAPLQVLKSDEASGYTQVKTASGQTGWVLTRQLSTEPSAKDRLSTAQRTLSTLKDENARLSKELERLRQAHASTLEERDRFAEENQRLAQELGAIRNTAAESLSILEENQGLKVSVADLENNLQSLRDENSILKDGSARDWFLVGAGVILLGILVGLILPRLRWQRRSSSWDTL